MRIQGHLYGLLATAFLSLRAAQAEYVDPPVLDGCPGYNATDVEIAGPKLTATLVLAGPACNVFGNDTKTMKMEAIYETGTRIHLKIFDPTTNRYEVPESVIPRPKPDPTVRTSSAEIQFNFTNAPFTFTISRTRTKEVLFSTTSHPLIFEPQYLRVKTTLPPNANIYGLGEHSEPFRLDPASTTRTLWSRNAFGVSSGPNLYGNHPVYFEHRTTGTHGVFLLNSNGMDVKLRNNETADGATTLEYNVIGGILDFYFLAGSEDDPAEVARQYAEVVGTPAEVPYWSFGLHQCRFGSQNYIEVANVISNYSAANIPLETMWVDIDYMYKRRVFTNDQDYFPTSRMREIVDYLHDHKQKFVLFTDPAVGYLPNEGYGSYDRGTALDIWLKAPDGSPSLGLVWTGVSVFPDWFHPEIGQYWTNEFMNFFSPQTGFDIDGIGIDMNEPASFCNFPCDDAVAQAALLGLPPARTSSPPDPNAPILGHSSQNKRKRVQPGDDVLNPPYSIDNADVVAISNHTAATNAVHANGLVEYDTHNLYGTMMSTTTQDAMLARRPGQRTLVITRSTFAGAGRKVGKWLGDNLSTWEQYRLSIAGMLSMATVYQVPMVGSDVCGFGERNTTELLCARWAMLGAFNPFMRNHNTDQAISQEFYQWPTVAQAARNILSIRYRLLDYLYTAFHTASLDGTPVLHPLWFKYPKDPTTFPIDVQFFFGDSILVSPVTDENSTSVLIYLPKDRFYDFATLAPVDGQGANVTLSNVDFTTIPLHIMGGAILPLRSSGAMTTAELREIDFQIIVAPGTDGLAAGRLYLDDGVSVTPKDATYTKFAYEERKFNATGTFGYKTGVKITKMLFLAVENAPSDVTVHEQGSDHKGVRFAHNATMQVLEVDVDISLTHEFSVEFQS
ncbi:glycoside hydrolase family 31 protein [Auriscalpium vulgare]|uniref:Glycoside hydrolase family 31 protein n=1 Tax=Auriscalpium vulgare TaxID=40419 RepID=A0ACB8R9U7_9AGAM|nr:glycoside hydrolase family 31 protein [Auriscalpium vulgare]